MKLLRLLLAIAAFALFMGDCAIAETPSLTDIQETQAEALDLEGLQRALPQEAADIMGSLTVWDTLDLDKSAALIAEAVLQQAGGIIRRAIRSAAMIFVVVIIVSAVGSVYDGGSVPDFIPLAGCLVVAVVAIGDVRSLIGFGAETLGKISDFSKILLPCLAAAGAAAGAVTSASAKYIATMVFVDILLRCAVGAVLPLVYGYAALILANGALGSEGLGSAAGVLKWMCITSLCALMLAFTGYLSLTGIISGSADAVASRALKSAFSTALPVVGSIVGDAASTVLAGAGMLRNAVGIFGMLAVASLCLTPFLSLGIHYLAYKGASILSASMPDKRLSGLISGIGSVFGIVLSLVGCGGFMMFFSIISSIKAVGA